MQQLEISVAEDLEAYRLHTLVFYLVCILVGVFWVSVLVLVLVLELEWHFP